jgi:hypothetical protein
VLSKDSDIAMMGSLLITSINLDHKSKDFGVATIYEKQHHVAFIQGTHTRKSKSRLSAAGMSVYASFVAHGDDLLICHFYSFCLLLGCDYLDRPGGCSVAFLKENFHQWCSSKE